MRSAAIVLAAFLAFVGRAASPPSGPPVIHSRSGQFTVHAAPQRISPANLSTNWTLVRLTPEFLAVSCERVKQALLDELRMKDQWRGAIHLFIVSGNVANQPVRIVSIPSTDGSYYRVDLPDELEAQKLVNGLVNVLLLEMINRSGAIHPAEVPVWMTVGWAGRLLAGDVPELLPQVSDRVAIGGRAWWVGASLNVRTGWDPALRAREHLRAHAALTFAQLSFPPESAGAGEGLAAFYSSAQLFLNELLNLPDGRAAFQETLRLMAGCLNWQTAFLRAFSAHFRSLLDVEKWWAVSLANATGRTDLRTLPCPAVAQKLDEILQVNVAVRRSPNEVPQAGRLTLQRVLKEWEYSRQRPILQEKLQLLALLRLNADPPCQEILNGYQRALAGYLQIHEQFGAGVSRGRQSASNAAVLLNDTVQRLDDLDRQRSPRPPVRPPPPLLSAKP